MNTLKRYLLEQFDRCYSQNGWFVAIRNAVDGLTAEEALWKPEGADNSIWQTLSHLTYYNYAYVERFKGYDFEYDIADNDATFTAGERTDEGWAAEVTRFDAVMNEFRGLIEKADESKLDELVSAQNARPWASLIADINAHNAYHAGQILMLRKLQGSWDRVRGVS
ncbi:MAG TPA: DinB family protein [Pyrinomonadaceae bacterium]|nr:DinB family protein [Pyrinomonadaceae bacterium]